MPGHPRCAARPAGHPGDVSSRAPQARREPTLRTRTSLGSTATILSTLAPGSVEVVERERRRGRPRDRDALVAIAAQDLDLVRPLQRCVGRPSDRTLAHELILLARADSVRKSWRSRSPLVGPTSGRPAGRRIPHVVPSPGATRRDARSRVDSGWYRLPGDDSRAGADVQLVQHRPGLGRRSPAGATTSSEVSTDAIGDDELHARVRVRVR